MESLIAECDSTTAIFLKDYLQLIEELPADLSKIISTYKEYEHKTYKLVEEMEAISKSGGSNFSITILVEKLNHLQEEKLKCGSDMNKLIQMKTKEFENQNVVAASSILPAALPMTETPVNKQKVKRGRKSKKPEPVPESTADASGINSSALMMLADVAVNRPVIPGFVQKKKVAEDSSVFRRRQESVIKAKIPVTKKNARRRRRRNKQTASEQEDQEAEEQTSDDKEGTETDENELLFCICNRPSYGNMVQCDNTHTCSIEWFHFSCVGVKKGPKGKWFCPKCRGKTAGKLKKDLVASSTFK